MRITSSLVQGLQFETVARGHTLTVDVPKDMGGSDAGPMPPELLVTALGTCIGIYAVNFCNKHNISTDGLKVVGVHPDQFELVDHGTVEIERHLGRLVHPGQHHGGGFRRQAQGQPGARGAATDVHDHIGHPTPGNPANLRERIGRFDIHRLIGPEASGHRQAVAIAGQPQDDNR